MDEKDETQKLPRIRGKSEYLFFLDRKKMADFLRQKGMKQQDIERLEIVMQKNSIIESGNADGIYNRKKQRIVVTTRDFAFSFSSYTKTSQREILFELNMVLLRQLCFALDTGNKRVDFWCLFQLFFWGLCSGGLLWVAGFCLFVFFPFLLAFPFFVACLLLQIWLTPKLLTFVNPYQKRANHFGVKHARNTMLFRQRETGRLWG